MKRLEGTNHQSDMTLASSLALLILACLMLSVWQKPPEIGQ